MITWLIISAVFVIILAIGFVLTPYLKKKGIISTQGAKTAEDLLGIAQTILGTLNINTNTKDKATLIFNIADTAVRYVEQTLEDSDNVTKKQKAYDTIISVLEKININLTDDIKSLIEIGIESAVNALPKK